MKVGVGLPNAVPGTSGEQLTGFARAADEAGFSSLGTIDRVVYPNYEPLTALAAAAAVTERIELMTTVMLGPLRLNAVQTAKQALSINQLSGGRLTLGIGIGGRRDDFEASGVAYEETGPKLETMLDHVRDTFEGDGVGPQDAGAPGILIGGHVEASFRRAAEYGEGWIAGGVSPDQFEGMAQQVRSAWSDAGREGGPRLACLVYFSLGENAAGQARQYLMDYMAVLGEETAAMIASSAATDARSVAGYLQAFEAVGCGELILFPCSGDPEQVTLLAEAAGL
ncbi:MAG: LLM class flavin-dependent oxidoreductase [Thermoleophilia bacterium]|nr:LLM class flavin-dependent oxidoreductase [Thermoleophilia bacterium]